MKLKYCQGLSSIYFSTIEPPFNGRWTMGSFKRQAKAQATGVRWAECPANAEQRIMRAAAEGGGSHGEKVQALPRPPSQTVYHEN